MSRGRKIYMAGRYDILVGIVFIAMYAMLNIGNVQISSNDIAGIMFGFALIVSGYMYSDNWSLTLAEEAIHVNIPKTRYVIYMAFIISGLFMYGVFCLGSGNLQVLTRISIYMLMFVDIVVMIECVIARYSRKHIILKKDIQRCCIGRQGGFIHISIFSRENIILLAGHTATLKGARQILKTWTSNVESKIVENTDKGKDVEVQSMPVCSIIPFAEYSELLEKGIGR